MGEPRNLRGTQNDSKYTFVSSQPFEPLVSLCHHRWIVPVVASIGPGRRFAVLQRDLGVARETLRRALDACLDRGLVQPNPGYGHPLRPEYLLTAQGKRIAEACIEVLRAAGAHRADLIGRKWSLPVLAAIASGDERFTEISDSLPGATPRALTRALTELEEAHCIRRDLMDERPRYRITSEGRGLAAAACALAEAAWEASSSGDA